MDKPVMKPTQQDQIVQISEPSLGPVDNVMDLKPLVVSTSRFLASTTVTMMNKTSQPSGNAPTVSTDTDDDTAVGDDGFEDTITGKSSCSVVGDETTRPQFMDTRLVVFSKEGI